MATGMVAGGGLTVPVTNQPGGDPGSARSNAGYGGYGGEPASLGCTGQIVQEDPTSPSKIPLEP